MGPHASRSARSWSTPPARHQCPGIYAAGDIVDYEGKVKLIATGFGEVATAVNNAFAYLNPGKSAFPRPPVGLRARAGRACAGGLADGVTAAAESIVCAGYRSHARART